MIRIFTVLLCLFFLTACAEDPEKAPLYVKASSFRDLPGWRDDNLADAVAAFDRSCARIGKKSEDLAVNPGLYIDKNTQKPLYYGDLGKACAALAVLPNRENETLRSFFEQWFQPYEARAGSQKEGLFTGYYEAALHGSKTKSGPYQYPLLRRPEDLVMVDLGEFRDELKGQRIAGRVKGAYLKPYEDREEIEEGALDDDKLALAWVDNPVDAFFLHIQGSGRVNMDDGSILRVGYDGQNGHPYYAIGRELVKRGYMDKDEVSMQTIRAFLESHPQEAQDIMNTNHSYVFFRKLTTDGPLGGEGTSLTPGRSLAVDHTKIPYGLPVWLDLGAPVDGHGPVRRLVVAQDTGGAIRGAVRGDVFWGGGPDAEYLAGHMKSQGRYWLLLPKQDTGAVTLSSR